MPQTIKSVLFFDYDSITRSLRSQAPVAADAFAQRVGDWLQAIEKGDVLTPPVAEGVRRRILVRRCYGDPKTIGNNRAKLIASGIQIIDCPPQEGRERSAAPIHIALDAIEALDHTTGFEEFIVLTADADMTPLLQRLAAHNRNAVVYSTSGTHDDYGVFAEAAVDEAALIRLLGGVPVAKRPAPTPVVIAEPEPPPAPRETRAAAPAGPSDSDKPYDRDELASLVRRIHHATRVPLFSPRVFADLFRFLALEIKENGYRFQTTAENVADRMIAIGRNVTRRQVGFVVKGLALKGHMFAPTDSPEHLADVFREQVLYLARSASLELSDRDKGMISAWIVGRSGAPAAPVAEAAPAPERAPAPAIVTPPPPPRPVPPPEPEPELEIEVAPEPPPVVEVPVARKVAPPRARPRPVEYSARERPQPTPPPAASEPPRKAEPEREEPPKAAPPPAKKTAPVAAERNARPAPRRGGAPEPVKEVPKPPRAPEPSGEDMENSILAAIAEAVDVLVEDRTTDQIRPPTAKSPPAPPTAAPSDSEDGSDDIGEEIQRILASYSQNRDKRR